MEVIADRETTDVSGPYYTGNFKETYRLVETGTSEWLKKVKAQLKDWDYSPIVFSISPWYNSVNRLFKEREIGGK